MAPNNEQPAAEPSSPADPDVWLRAMRDAARPKWSKITIPGALTCLPIIAAWLFVGMEWGHEWWVMYSIAGAVTAAFGAFQKLAQSRIRPMAILLAGMAIAIWTGNVAGYFGWY